MQLLMRVHHVSKTSLITWTSFPTSLALETPALAKTIPSNYPTITYTSFASLMAPVEVQYIFVDT